MSCVDARLDEFLDNELDEAARAATERHLASCAACRDEIEKSRRLESILLKTAPPGAAPDTDRFLQLVQARSRRKSAWRFTAAAVLLAGIVALVASPYGGKASDLRGDLALFAQKKDADAAEARIRAAGPAAFPILEKALEDADIKIQFAAATLLFKHADDATRNRVLARYQAAGEKSHGWNLLPVGFEEDDAEIIPVAVSMVAEGQERWAMDVLKRLNRLDRMARGKVMESVVTLLRSPNPKVQKLALDIVKELEIEFPLSAIVDLLDSPELGGEALRILRQATKKDFGKDKDAWKKLLEHTEGL